MVAAPVGTATRTTSAGTDTTAAAPHTPADTTATSTPAMAAATAAVTGTENSRGCEKGNAGTLHRGYFS